MEKRQYEQLKQLRAKVAAGTATFKERNVIRIIDKRLAKGSKITVTVK